MRSTRRQFISQMAVGGFGAASLPVWAQYASAASEPQTPVGAASAVSLSSIQARYNRFVSGAASHVETVSWIEIDLSEIRPISSVSVRLPTGLGENALSRVDVSVECSEDFRCQERFPLGKRSQHCTLKGSLIETRLVEIRQARFVRVEMNDRRKDSWALRPHGGLGIDYIEIVSEPDLILISPSHPLQKRPLFKRVRRIIDAG